MGRMAVLMVEHAARFIREGREFIVVKYGVAAGHGIHGAALTRGRRGRADCRHAPGSGSTGGVRGGGVVQPQGAEGPRAVLSTGR